MDNMKVCKKCGEAKSLDLFYNDKNSKDGRCFRCKVCMNETTYANYQKKRKPKKDWSTDSGFKICHKCLVKKPVSDFNIHQSVKNRNKDGLRGECKVCQSEFSRQYYKTIAVEERAKRKIYHQNHKEEAHGWHLKRKFNIPLDEYQRILDLQGGKCAICGSASPGGKHTHFPVDHDHVTGKIRGLLCSPCNTGMGHFQDDPLILQKAIDYLNSTLGGLKNPQGN